MNGEAGLDVASWLTSIGMSAYIDLFHEEGYYSMLQLDEFMLEDLSKMKIGTSHRNKIWKSLCDYRSGLVFTTGDSQSQDLQRSASSTSTISVTSQNSISQNSTYCPGYYEVTRYTFKHTVSFVKDDKSEKKIKV